MIAVRHVISGAGKVQDHKPVPRFVFLIFSSRPVDLVHLNSGLSKYNLEFLVFQKFSRLSSCAQNFKPRDPFAELIAFLSF